MTDAHEQHPDHRHAPTHDAEAEEWRGILLGTDPWLKKLADELLVSWQTWKASGLPIEGLDRRPVTLAGRAEPLEVVHWHAPEHASA